MSHLYTLQSSELCEAYLPMTPSIGLALTWLYRGLPMMAWPCTRSRGQSSDSSSKLIFIPKFLYWVIESFVDQSINSKIYKRFYIFILLYLQFFIYWKKLLKVLTRLLPCIQFLNPFHTKNIFDEKTSFSNIREIIISVHSRMKLF